MMMFQQKSSVVPLGTLCMLLWFNVCRGFVLKPFQTTQRMNGPNELLSLSSSAFSRSRMKCYLTPLPKGISPFEKGMSKSMDIQGDFRKLAVRAVNEATKNNAAVRLMEIEFPPLLGGDKSKSQFDDFDNIQELDRNKDWVVQFAPTLSCPTWLIFPDLKECEITKKEWQGKRYTQYSTFTTIETVVDYLGSKYDAPWGANLVSGLSKTFGKDGEDLGLMGDASTLDDLASDEKEQHIKLFIQPGNGGPVEDWINIEKIHDNDDSQSPIIIVNGALDKVRDGFYPAIFFPKLAATVDRFYKQFESILYIKPISDKGVYGWLFRVYPEVSTYIHNHNNCSCFFVCFFVFFLNSPLLNFSFISLGKLYFNPLKQIQKVVNLSKIQLWMYQNNDQLIMKLWQNF